MKNAHIKIFIVFSNASIFERMPCNHNVYYMFHIIESKLIKKKPKFPNQMHAMVEKNTTVEMGVMVKDSCTAMNYQYTKM